MNGYMKIIKRRDEYQDFTFIYISLVTEHFFMIYGTNLLGAFVKIRMEHFKV